MRSRVISIAALLSIGIMLPLHFAYAGDLFTKTLKSGAKGAEVKKLQTYLRIMPGIYPNGAIIGKYGPKTTAAVRRFQAQYRIRRTGVVDKDTLRVLNQVAPRLTALLPSVKKQTEPPGPPVPPSPAEQKPIPPAPKPPAVEPLFKYSWRATSDLQGEVRVPTPAPKPVVVLDGAPVSLPATGAATRLANLYKIYLVDDEVAWDDVTSGMILEMLRRLPNSQFGWGDYKPWRIALTSDELGGDIQIISEDGNIRRARISKAAFLRSNPTLRPSATGNSDRVFFSNRLFRAVLKIFYNKDFLIKEAIETRYGLQLGYAEPRDEFQDFTVDEMHYLASVFEDLPAGYWNMPGLQKIVRRRTGMTNPGQPEASAIAWTSPGYIEFMDKAFTSGSADYILRLIAHEMSHFLWDKMLTSETQSQFNKLSGWYKVSRDTWRHKTTINFMSVHATLDPLEDFAETMAYYLYDPDAVRTTAPEKYEFVKKVVDGYEYVTFVDKKYTFQVFNLDPDLTYPGKIMGVDVEVKKDSVGENIVTATLHLSPALGDGAAQATARITSPALTYVDVTFDPVGGDRFTLRSFFTISKYAANGYWVPDSITVRDQVDNRRYESQHQFGWLLAINNKDEDLDAPQIEDAGVAIVVTPQEKDQLVRVYVPISDKNTEGLYGAAYLVHEERDEKIFDYAEYDATTRRLVFEYPVRTYHASGTWTFREVNVFDAAGNGRRIDLRGNSKVVAITTSNPDYIKPEIDLSKVTITATARHPELPNGETDVSITYAAWDNFAGLGWVTYQLLKPNGQTIFDYHYHENFYTPHFEGDARESKIYRIRLTLPPGSIPGTWALSEIVLHDKADNILTSKFVEAGILKKFSVY